MRRSALLAALLLGAMVAAPAAASPQPTPVCRFCGGLFESAAADVGVNATVGGSDVLVGVHPDGSATWTVRISLTNGSAAFARTPARLEAAARTALDDSYGLPDGASFVDARLDGDVAVLRYRDPDAAARHAGLLVVDTLHDRGGEPRYHVNADRFTVRGPPGTAVANRPESGTVRDRSVTWRGAGDGEWGGGTALDGSPYVVFGPDRSGWTRLRAAAAVGLATLPVLVRGVRHFLLVQTAAFTVLLAAVVAVFRRWSPRPSPDALAGFIGVVGLLGAAGPAAVNGPGWIAGPPLLALGLAGLVASGRWADRLGRPRGQALAIGVVLAGTYAALLALHLALESEWTNPPVVALRATALAFPLAAMVPLGGALAVRPDRIRPWFALAVVGFVAVPLAMVDLADPPTGLGGGLFAVFLLVVAIAAPLVGALSLGLGWSLAAADRA